MTMTDAAVGSRPDLLPPELREAIFGNGPADLITADQRRALFGKTSARERSRSGPRPIIASPKAMPVLRNTGVAAAESSWLKKLEVRLRRVKWDMWITLVALIFGAIEMIANIAFHLIFVVFAAALLENILDRGRRH